MTPSRARWWIEQHRVRLAVVAVMLVAGYFLVAFGEQAWRARELRAEAASLEAEIARIEAENQALQAQIDRWDAGGYEDDARARARRDLGLASPGETVVLVRWEGSPAPAATTTSASEDERQPNWRRWLDALTPE